MRRRRRPSRESVLLDFGDFEITKRELLASISIIAIMLLVGFLIGGRVSDYQMDQNEKYNKAVKIETQDLFEYGMRTNIGNAFVYGDLLAVDTVTYPEMLILMLKHDMPIDVVFWADTGMEFPEMYRHINQLDTYLYRKRGIHITRLKERHTFEWMMFKKPITKKGAVENRLSKGLPLTGYGWPGKTVRWCTGYLKTHLIDRQLRQLSKGRTVVQYIGFAADEKNRCKDDPQFKYPLVEFGVTEKQALDICYAHGFRC